MKCVVIIVLALLCGSAEAGLLLRGGGGAVSCLWTGSVAGSCLPASDTTDTFVGPRAYSPTFSDTIGFNSGTGNLLSINGAFTTGCPGYLFGINGNGCFTAALVRGCLTPGNITTNSHPWLIEGVVSWQPLASVNFTPVGSNGIGVTFTSGSPNISWPNWPSGQLVGTMVTFSGSPPSPFVAGTYYIVVASPSANTVQLALLQVSGVPMGAALVAGGNGTAVAQPIYPSAPYYYPYLSLENTAATISLGLTQEYPSQLQGSLCGTLPSASFTDTAYGQFPNIWTATAAMTSGDVLTVGPPPTGIPFWLTIDDSVGPLVGHNPNPQNLTINCTGGAAFGYGNTFKGVFNIENNGTTIDGCTGYWLTPSNSQAIFAWDAGLDLTLTNDHCEMAEDCILRANIRSGITTLTNDIFEDAGWQGAGALGSLHSFYIGSVVGPNGHNGFDTVNITNVFSADTIGQGWSAKLRPPNSNITASFFGCRVNSGACANHAAMDVPCGGIQSATNSVFSRNAYGASTNPFNNVSFLISIYEEATLNAATGSDANPPTVECSTVASLPSASFSATITGSNTFTTTTNPATLFPFTAIGGGGLAMWDLGASGLMQQQAIVQSWTGPVAGVYTVTVAACVAEGTLSQTAFQGSLACFQGTGTTTMYALNFVSIVTNTPTSASVSTSINPAPFGFHTGDVISDGYNRGVISSITGSGPYTISIGSCTINNGSNCLFPAGQQSHTLTEETLFKGGPVQIDASTTGTGCDGHNILCGITNAPIGTFLGQHLLALGTDIASGNNCFVAGQIASIQPLGGSTGSGYAVNDTITLAGGTFETAAVVKVTSVSSGAITGVSMNSGGIYTALPKTFTQGATSGSGTGAQFQFPFPQPIFGGSAGNYTIRLAQDNGADCITGATTNQTYQFLTPSKMTYDKDIVIWDGPAPTVSTFNAYVFAPWLGGASWQSLSVSNSLIFGDSINNGPGWTITTNGTMNINGTDGGGNVFCNYRGDTTTSARCAMPPFTAASGLTGSIAAGSGTTGTFSVPGGASACQPGMYIWDTNEGAPVGGTATFPVGQPNWPIGGTRIVSGGPTSFALYIPPGGAGTRDVTSRSTMACGWGTPSSAFNGTVASGTGILTVNSGLVGSIHVNDYLADISSSLPSNVQITSQIDATHFNTNWPSAVSAEYMVSVR